MTLIPHPVCPKENVLEVPMACARQHVFPKSPCSMYVRIIRTGAFALFSPTATSLNSYEKVNFEDSQSVDEPDARPTLGDRPTVRWSVVESRLM